MPYESGVLISKHPCAQCGQPIASPLWTERERNRVSFLWSCSACDYQFVTVAVLKSEMREDPVPRQPPVAEVVTRDEPAIAA